MATATTPWQAHESCDYDRAMGAHCAALVAEIRADANRRQAILKDPRALHWELFASFAPTPHPEYAGTYRGTPNTPLVGRNVSSKCLLRPGSTYNFVLAAEVSGSMDLLLKEARQLLDDGGSDYGKLLALTYVFCWFGKIHPFLDGNGHVQRALFAAMATEFELPLSSRFSIHPRPYGELLAMALELFASAPIGKENDELAVVAEYLGFFLDGPFVSPRAHLSTASPYV